MAVAPAIATAILVGTGFTRRASVTTRLFAALTLATLVTVIGSVALVSASLDVDGTENLNERYVFYVVPLLILGLAIWIERGLERLPPLAPIVAIVCCAAPVLMPIDRFDYNAGFQSVALLPWLALPLTGVALAACVAAFTSACGAIWATSRRETSGRLWLLVGTVFVLVGVVTYFSNSESASNSASAFAGRSPTWIDEAVPRGSEVAVLVDTRLEGATSMTETSAWLMVSELLNRSVGTVYRLGPPTYYEIFLPTVPVGTAADGSVVGKGGDPLRSRFLLVSCRTDVGGDLVADAPRGLLRVVELEGPVRVRAGGTCDRSGGA